MPFGRLTLRAPITDRASVDLAHKIAGLIATVLRKRLDLTSVLVEHLSLGGWIVGGAVQDASAHLQVNVTAGTNSAEEKEEFVRQAMEVLGSHVPGLHVATYVVVQEVPATDWGYGGRTQAERAKASPTNTD